MNEVNTQGEKVWDTKKVGIFILILAFAAIGLFYGFKDQRFKSAEDVRGVQTEEENLQESRVEPPTFDGLQTTFQEKINEIKEDTESIDIAEVASSSPQIQKVINDIKNLQNYPRSQAKEACFNICEGL